MTFGLVRSRIAQVSALCAVTVIASGCENPEAHKPAPEAIAQGQARFSDATEEAGLSGFEHATGAFGKKWFPETMGSGLAVIDFDGDGWLDLMVASGGTWA